MLSRQLPTRPLPVAPVPVELLQTELQVYLMVFILNNYLNNFMSHLKKSLPCGKLLGDYFRQQPLIPEDEFFLFGAQVVSPPGQCLHLIEDG